MALPRDILEAAERVLEYHRSSKLDEHSKPLVADLRTRAPAAHLFDFLPRTPLSNRLMDISIPVLTLLAQGLEALPESLQTPPQDLRTLSSWLHLSAGLRQRVSLPWGQATLRAAPSADLTYPGEIYVAAMSIEGLTPGLYHYSIREHALRHLRGGAETLALLRRGRPDLQFLATVPCALLVSTVFSRSSWLAGKRGYRQSLIDAGHLIANLHAAAMGLGMSTVTRLRMLDSSMRELIGIPEDADYAHAESVQAIVVWADGAVRPMDNTTPPPPGVLPTIPRPACDGVPTFGSVLAVHHDAIATGVAVREVRPPLTDLTPVPSTVPMTRLALSRDDHPSRSLRSVLLEPAHVEKFHPRPLARDLLVRLARCTFRGGTFFPLRPDGPHVALIRPFWIVQDVVGQDPGIWWYDPLIDKWAQLNHGEYRYELMPLVRNREIIAQASAICVMVANLKRLLGDAGPDLYRLALLEAGVTAQRLNLAASSIGMACRIFGDFLDDPWKQFLGLGATGWEPLAICAIGGVAGQAAYAPIKAGSSPLEFRD